MRVLFILFVFVLGSCKSTSNTNNSLRNENCSENDTGVQLCVYNNQNENQNTSFSYEIIDAAGVKILEGKIEKGYIKWIDNSNVEFFDAPGTIRQGIEDEELISVFNVFTKMKRTKLEYLKELD